MSISIHNTKYHTLPVHLDGVTKTILVPIQSSSVQSTAQLTTAPVTTASKPVIIQVPDSRPLGPTTVVPDGVRYVIGGTPHSGTSVLTQPNSQSSHAAFNSQSAAVGSRTMMTIVKPNVSVSGQVSASTAVKQTEAVTSKPPHAATLKPGTYYVRKVPNSLPQTVGSVPAGHMRVGPQNSNLPVTGILCPIPQSPCIMSTVVTARGVAAGTVPVRSTMSGTVTARSAVGSAASVRGVVTSVVPGARPLTVVLPRTSAPTTSLARGLIASGAAQTFTVPSSVRAAIPHQSTFLKGGATIVAPKTAQYEKSVFYPGTSSSEAGRIGLPRVVWPRVPSSQPARPVSANIPSRPPVLTQSGNKPPTVTYEGIRSILEAAGNNNAGEDCPAPHMTVMKSKTSGLESLVLENEPQVITIGDLESQRRIDSAFTGDQSELRIDSVYSLHDGNGVTASEFEEEFASMMDDESMKNMKVIEISPDDYYDVPLETEKTIDVKKESTDSADETGCGPDGEHVVHGDDMQVRFAQEAARQLQQPTSAASDSPNVSQNLDYTALLKQTKIEKDDSPVGISGTCMTENRPDEHDIKTEPVVSSDEPHVCVLKSEPDVSESVPAPVPYRGSRSGLKMPRFKKPKLMKPALRDFRPEDQKYLDGFDFVRHCLVELENLYLCGKTTIKANPRNIRLLKTKPLWFRDIKRDKVSRRTSSPRTAVKPTPPSSPYTPEPSLKQLPNNSTSKVKAPSSPRAKAKPSLVPILPKSATNTTMSNNHNVKMVQLMPRIPNHQGAPGLRHASVIPDRGAPILLRSSSAGGAPRLAFAKPATANTSNGSKYILVKTSSNSFLVPYSVASSALPSSLLKRMISHGGGSTVTSSTSVAGLFSSCSSASAPRLSTGDSPSTIAGTLQTPKGCVSFTIKKEPKDTPTSQASSEPRLIGRKRPMPPVSIDLNKGGSASQITTAVPSVESASDRIKRLKESLKKQNEDLERIKREREESRKLLEEFENDD